MKIFIPDIEIVSLDYQTDIIQSIRNFSYELIIIGIELNDTQRLNICSKLKENKNSKEIPIIIILDKKNDIEKSIKDFKEFTNSFLNHPFDELNMASFISSIIKIKKNRDFLKTELNNRCFELQDKTDELERINTFNKEIIHNEQIGIAVYDREFRYLLWNPYMENMTGVKSQDVIGKDALDLFPHIINYGLDKLIVKAMKGEIQRYNGFIYKISESGKTGWASVIYGPHYDEDGEIIGVIGFFTDITEQKKREGELLLAKNIFDNMQLGLYVFKLEDFNDDRSLKLVIFNPASSQLTGLKDKNIVGKYIDDIFPELRKLNLPRLYANVVRHKLPVALPDIEYGDKNIPNAIFSVKAFPLPDNQVGISFDNITDIKRLEYDLKESEEKFRSLAENTGDFIMRYDRNLRHIYANKKAIDATGLVYDQYIGKTHREMGIFDPELIEIWEKAIENVFLTGNPHREQFDWIGENHNKYYLDWQLFPEFNEKGEVATVLGVSRDITEIKETEEKIKESEERLRMALKGTIQGVWEWDIVTDKIIFDDNWLEILGFDSNGNTFDINWWLQLIHPDSIEEIMKVFDEFKKGNKEFIELKYKMKTAKNNWKWIWTRGKNAAFDENGNPTKIIGTHRDITIEKDIEDKNRLFQYQTMSLWNLAKLQLSSFETICSYILEEIVIQSSSLYGFFGFISDDQTIMTIFSWSKNAMKDCSIHNKPIDYVLKDSGIWAESVRSGKSIIINDYEAPNNKKLGLPDGHVKIKRFMAIPVIVNDKVVSIGAVANKENNYNEDDLIRLETFLNSAQMIIDRKKADEKLIESLREKEVLLKEIHHRVKNNMQIVSSLIGLQIMNQNDGKVISILEDAKNRIMAMALVHEKLYRSESFTRIDIKDFIKKIELELSTLYSEVSKRVNTIIDVDDIFLSIDYAIPCALLINELLTNCFKHAFPDNREGNININLKKEGDLIYLTISDNGVGIKKEIDIDRPNSSGMEIIYSLTKQIRGDIFYNSENGVCFKIIFKDMEN